MASTSRPARSSRRFKITAALVGILVIFGLTASGCALFGKATDDFLSAFQGRAATMSTYDEDGNVIDRVKGSSFDLRRDDTFDSKNSDGTSNEDSQVLRISVGDHMINHVGSTLLLADDGIIRVSDAPSRVDLENSDSGSPWMNRLYQSFTNNFQGTARSVMVRSQSGVPIAVFAGNHVEYFATEVPKTTWLRIDGKNLIIYRADYTIYDNGLLG